MFHMKTLLVFLIATAFFITTPFGFSQNDSQDEAKKYMEKVSLGNPGVTEVQFDDKGKITSILVVSKTRISTVLGKTEGVKIARQKAELESRGSIIKFLNGSNVKIYEANDSEVVLALEGKEEAGKDDSKSELGKKVDKTTTKIESLSSGIVKALVSVYENTDAVNKELTTIMAWSPKYVKAANQAVKVNEKNGSSQKTDKTPVSETKRKTDNSDKELETKSATSPSAVDFLPKKKKE